MKIALIYSFNESNWFSCTKIVKNLLHSYDIALEGHEIIRVNYNFEDTKFSLSDAVALLGEHKPEKIIFLDHKPHPLELFQKMQSDLGDYSPDIFVHIFGDFTLNFLKWLNSSKYLKGKKLKFFCASDAQKLLVDKCLQVTNTISKIPFPVSEEEFYFDNSFKSIREKYKASSDDTLFLYTGRLSAQKKIVQLLESFHRALEEKIIPENSKLLLAGSFDSIGFQFGGIWEEEGEYFRTFDRKLKSFPESTQAKIQYIGMVPNLELKDYYNDVDYFVSFSTYHDEDYGMSVAEAGSCGTPLVLTEWAGFKSFFISNQTYKVKTISSDKEPCVDMTDALKTLKSLKKSTEKEREASSKIFNSYCSVNSVAELLKKEIFEELTVFEGFNDFMAKLARLSLQGNILFFDEYNRALNNNYRELYDVYYS